MLLPKLAGGEMPNRVPKHTNDRLQGTLDLVVLKMLEARGPMHGYAMVEHIGRISNQVLRVQEGSLYPALHRMTQAGWLRAEWRQSENRRRARYYTITAAGRRQLAEEERNWAALTGAVAHLLRHA
jgi:PadR family transcriptional regulator, regulatory protein PadR